MKVYFDGAALERVAKGQDLYSWNYTVRNETETPPKNGILVAEFTALMPTREECIAPALAILAEKEASLRETLNEDLRELEERRNALIMLEFQS